jgi:hypothetical protein
MRKRPCFLRPRFLIPPPLAGRVAASGSERSGWGRSCVVVRCNPTRRASLATLPFQGRDKKADMRHRPYSLAAPGRPSSDCIPCAHKTRARGTPRVPEDPRASTPRDIEACRSPVTRLRPCGLRRASRKSAKSQGVPRAVFEGNAGDGVALSAVMPAPACAGAGSSGHPVTPVFPHCHHRGLLGPGLRGDDSRGRARASRIKARLRIKKPGIAAGLFVCR